jgi:hypothetical protein
MPRGQGKQKEPEDIPRSPSNSGSSGGSSSAAEIVVVGVVTAKDPSAPVRLRVAGTHGSDHFLVCVDEIGLAQAAGAPAGNSDESVLIGGGRAFQVGVRWSDEEDPEDEDAKQWKAVSNIGNGSKFCDADGDFDPDSARVPHDVWQMAYGKIVAPLPGDDEDGSEAKEGVHHTVSV